MTPLLSASAHSACAPSCRERASDRRSCSRSIGAADALDEPLIALLGAQEYYGRFGFVAAAGTRSDRPEADWGEHFQVRTLTAWRPSITGTFRYASPFTSVT